MCPLYRTSPDTARSATRGDVTANYDVSHEGSARVLHRHFDSDAAGWRQQTVSAELLQDIPRSHQPPRHGQPVRGWTSRHCFNETRRS